MARGVLRSQPCNVAKHPNPGFPTPHMTLAEGPMGYMSLLASRYPSPHHPTDTQGGGTKGESDYKIT